MSIKDKFMGKVDMVYVGCLAWVAYQLIAGDIKNAPGCQNTFAQEEFYIETPLQKTMIEAMWL
jgi:hypothetical protein